MAKDRFKTRASYDSEFKYGPSYYPPIKNKRSVTAEQTKLMRTMYNSNKLSSWEKDFVKSLLGFSSISKKQKETLKKIYIKISK